MVEEFKTNDDLKKNKIRRNVILLFAPNKIFRYNLIVREIGGIYDNHEKYYYDF
jgi:hypothetical protein